MRLFVAIDIDEQTRAQLAPAREAMQRVLGRARVPPRITWVKDEAAHVTVRFIGEVSNETAQVLERTLAEPLPIDPFDVRWDRLGTFPGRGNPRVIWVGAGSGDERLAALAEAVNERVAPIVGQPDSRPFKGHLTVGRVKEPGKGANWAEALATAPFTPAVMRVDHATLYLSRPSPKGPTYTALSTADFNSGP